jgi:hypothetical protein
VGVAGVLPVDAHLAGPRDVVTLALRQSSRKVADGWWEWAVWVGGTPAELDGLLAVVYTLHPTFPEPVQRITNRRTGFKLKSAGWGEFEVFARLERRTGRPLSRKLWLDFGRLPAEDQDGSDRAKPRSVFLSYSVSDAPKVDRLRSALEEQGISVVAIDDVVPVGGSIAATVERVLRRADAAIVIESDKRSPWAQIEARAAKKLNMPTAFVTLGAAHAHEGSEPIPWPDKTDASTMASQILATLARGLSGGTGD